MKFQNEENKNKLKRNLVIFVLVLASVVLFYYFNNHSGLISLTHVGNETENEAINENLIEEAEEPDEISGRLPIYFEILKPTEIKVSRAGNEKIGFCPEYGKLKLNVQNRGNAKAEAVLMEVINGKVKNCEKCEIIKVLESTKEKEIEIEACRESENEIKFIILKFYAVNSNAYEIRLD